MSSNETVEKEQEMMRCHGGRRWYLKFPFIVGVILLATLLVQVLWNHLIPELFHGPVITYGQGLGLMVLSRLLFGFGGFRRGHHHGHGGFGRGRWLHMSPEEREKLREEFRKRHHDESPQR